MARTAPPNIPTAHDRRPNSIHAKRASLQAPPTIATCAPLLRSPNRHQSDPTIAPASVPSFFVFVISLRHRFPMLPADMPLCHRCVVPFTIPSPQLRCHFSLLHHAVRASHLPSSPTIYVHRRLVASDVHIHPFASALHAWQAPSSRPVYPPFGGTAPDRLHLAQHRRRDRRIAFDHPSPPPSSTSITPRTVEPATITRRTSTSANHRHLPRLVPTIPTTFGHPPAIAANQSARPPITLFPPIIALC